MSLEYKYPIKLVSQATGLSVHVIRAWEKRYNAIEPDRTDTNRRLYSEEDIEKLRLLNEAVHLGHNIGSIARLSLQELNSLLHKDLSNNFGAKRDSLLTESAVNEDQIILECVDAIKAYDSNKLESLLLNASTSHTQPILIEKIILPLVYKVGELWHEGEIRIANEHLATSVIRSFLMNLIDSYSMSSAAPKLVSATPLGQEHELGALITGVVAASAGWKVIYLGVSLPAEEIASVVTHLNVKAVALSIVYPNDDPHLRKELRKFKHLLTPGVPIIVGGRSVRGYLDVLDEIGAIVVRDTKQFRLELEAIRESKYN